MSFIIDENGQSIVEYALVLGLIAIVSLVVLLAFGPKIRNMFNDANNAADKAA